MHISLLELKARELIASALFSFGYPGLAPTTSPWASTPYVDPSFTAYGGGAFPSGQYLEEARFGPPFNVPGSNSDRSGTNLPMGMEVPASMLEQSFPVVHRPLHAPQPYPPPPDWTVAGQSWQPSSSWNHPVPTAGYADHNLDMRPPVPHLQVAASSVITRHSDRRVIPTGYSAPMATPSSVQLSTHGPVSVAGT